MGRYWRNVDNRCKVCRNAVGKISIRNGKIVVEKYDDNWGCWCKTPNKSEMQVMCRDCQRAKGKELRKRENQ